MDQNRQENIPAQHTLQVHMHFLCCPCSNVMYPYYPPGYRPPILLQPPPIPRPSYLHHYQYTQLHLNPAYNVSLPPSISQALPLTMNQQAQQTTTEIAFEPPPRDRRILDKSECDEPRFLTDDKMDRILTNFSPLGESVTNSIEHLQDIFKNLTATQVASLTTENYIKYLDNGCFIGETIAKRNEQRPCFKNIQNLCNRTRSEVMKPNITVSNIHSQGVPWATKDFIFAFVRAINCWCILRGYLGSKDGNLGKIEREISTEFRECYANWEKCTKQLTHYLIQTFHNLDEANSSSNANYAGPSTSINSVARSKYSSPRDQQQRKPPVEAQPQPDAKTKEIVPVKKIPGILHIPSASSTELVEVCNPTSESTEISPRDEDSDTERRIYMKPGSYNVPTKNRTKSPTGTSSNRIEFFNKARNTTRKTDNSDSYNSDDQVWQTAQSVTPDFIKHHEESPFNNSVKKIYDMSLMQPNKQIESWLNNELNVFGYISHDVDDERLSQTENNWQSTSDKSKTARGSDCEVTPRPFPIGKEYSMLRKNNWEFKNGGLTNAAREVFENIFQELERTNFAKNFNFYLGIHLTDALRTPPDLSMIIKKLKTKSYCYISEVVHDFRHFICYVYHLFSHDRYVLNQIDVVQEIFEKMLKQAFAGVDFQHIIGVATDALGPLIVNEREKPKINTEGDGDH